MPTNVLARTKEQERSFGWKDRRLHCFAKGNEPRAVFLDNCDAIKLPLDAAADGRASEQTRNVA
jgi:hypothetical protein